MNNPPRPPSPTEIQEGASNAAIPAGQPAGHVLPPAPGPPAWPGQSGPPNQADYRTQDLHPDRGGFIFTFGFISFFVPVLGLVFGPIAWSMGSTDLKRMRSGTMDISGRGLTQIGYTLGIFATIIWMITAATFLVLVVAVQFNFPQPVPVPVPVSEPGAGWIKDAPLFSALILNPMLRQTRLNNEEWDTRSADLEAAERIRLDEGFYAVLAQIALGITFADETDPDARAVADEIAQLRCDRGEASSDCRTRPFQVQLPF